MTDHPKSAEPVCADPKCDGNHGWSCRPDHCWCRCGCAAPLNGRVEYCEACAKGVHMLPADQPPRKPTVCTHCGRVFDGNPRCYDAADGGSHKFHADDGSPCADDELADQPTKSAEPVHQHTKWCEVDGNGKPWAGRSPSCTPADQPTVCTACNCPHSLHDATPKERRCRCCGNLCKGAGMSETTICKRDPSADQPSVERSEERMPDLLDMVVDLLNDPNRDGATVRAMLRTIFNEPTLATLRGQRIRQSSDVTESDAQRDEDALKKSADVGPTTSAQNSEGLSACQLYTVAPSREHVGDWIASAEGPDGEMYLVFFSGPDAKARAEEYARAERKS
jgi:hypothetical protein